jgi:hypothetical protein
LFQFIAVVFVVICGFKAYQEFWKPTKVKSHEPVE